MNFTGRRIFTYLFGGNRGCANIAQCFMRVESPAGSKKTTGAEGRKSDVIASEIILNAKQLQATVREEKHITNAKCVYFHAVLHV